MSDLADWVAAIGTAAATLIAAGALAVQQRDRRRAQAEAVTAWIKEREEPSRVVATLHVLNSGTQPVFQVVVRAVGYKGHTRDAWPLGELPPGEQTQTGGREWGDHMDDVEPPRLEIYFQDAAGRGWHRKPNGRLGRAWRPRTAYHHFMKWTRDDESMS